MSGDKRFINIFARDSPVTQAMKQATGHRYMKVTEANHFTSQFLSYLSSFNLTQHVHFPTHEHNHTLDLVITSPHSSLSPSASTTCITPSDHFPIFTKPYQLHTSPCSHQSHFSPPSLHRHQFLSI